MTKKALWNDAYKRMLRLYGESPDLRIISRFLSEKQMLEQFDCITYFDIIAKLRAESREKDEERPIGKSVLGSCFAAFLLGATDVNPLPLHKYCPNCKQTAFVADDKSLTPYDLAGDTCQYCGGRTCYNGFDIPFETYLPCVKKGAEFNHGNYKEIHDELAFHITPSLCELNEKCKKLERQTGVRMDDICLGDKTVLSDFCRGDFVGAPEKEAKILREMAVLAKPETYGDILKLLGLAHGTQTWRYNAEELLADGSCSLSAIPATRDDVFMMIRTALQRHGIGDTGFAYDVASKARRGYYFEHGLDGYTLDTLKSLGLGAHFADYILRARYLTSKAHVAAELKYLAVLQWYASR